MKIQYRVLLGVVVAIGAATLLRLLIGNSPVALLQTGGPVAASEMKLIVIMVLIMLCAVIPLLILLYTFAWKYRADNPKLHYAPESRHSPWAEVSLWLIPTTIALIFSVFIWNSAHQLDPSQAIKSANPTLNIKVVALQWKWLFIYPDQNIATVNLLEFPTNTPLHFSLTADAPMTTFWIPQLGSQIYAMSGMVTQLNLLADHPGDYLGKNTEINGAGYAGMTFTARAVTSADFNNWLKQVKQSQSPLTTATYDKLAQPSQNNPMATYASVQPGLFDNVVMKSMNLPATSSMPGMSM